MRKFLLTGTVLMSSFAAMSAVAATNMGRPGITISSNVGAVAMNCVSNNGGTGPAITINSTPYFSWWGGITSNFNGTNLQCTFSLQNNPKAIIGTERIRVWASSTGNLSATIDRVQSGSGYVLTATGSKMAKAHVNSFYNYTVIMNSK